MTMTMTKQTTERPIHHYDTARHRILCGSPGVEDHSTKHPRRVTCDACLALLREQGEHVESTVAATGGTGV